MVELASMIVVFLVSLVVNYGAEAHWYQIKAKPWSNALLGIVFNILAVAVLIPFAALNQIEFLLFFLAGLAGALFLAAPVQFKSRQFANRS